MLITTCYHPEPGQVQEARRLAAEAGAEWVPRGRHSLAALRQASPDGRLLVVSAGRLSLYGGGEGEGPLFFHPSMAQVRIKRLLAGEQDTLLTEAGVQPGYRVIDCTAGLASDAILLSYAAGEKGHVIALESEPVLALLLKEGLKHYRSGLDPMDQAMRRIEVIACDHAPFLRQLPGKSLDIVYFDPMFRVPVGESSSMSPLRGTANSAPLEPSSVAEAVRVARVKVVLKEHRASREFERLGFAKTERSHTKIAYGVIEP